MILISSKLVLFHANDLLDLRFLQTGSFHPHYSQSSPSDAILEIVCLVESMLAMRNVTIHLNVDQLEYYY